MPYERSAIWRAHDEYYRGRGIKAWGDGLLPTLATNNRGLARQVGALVVRHVDELLRTARISVDEPLSLHELGAGKCGFAVHLLRALDEDLGDAGRALARRLSYVASDFVERTFHESLAEDAALAAMVAAGRIVPAHHDGRSDAAPEPWPGAALPRGRTIAVVCNYLLCVLPVHVIQKRRDGWYALWLRGNGNGNREADRVWRPATLAELFPDPLHAGAVEGALSELEEATLSIGAAAFGLVDRARQWLAPDGLLVVNDFGQARPGDHAGLHELLPLRTGDGLNHPVPFAALGEWARLVGASRIATDGPYDDVHTLVMTFAGRPADWLRSTFVDRFVATHEAHELLDLVQAGRRFLAAEDDRAAARSLTRALAIDGDQPRVRELLAQAAERVTRILPAAAPRAIALAMQGDEHERAGRFEQAIRCYRAALAIDPGERFAAAALERIRDDWWSGVLARIDPRQDS